MSITQVTQCQTADDVRRLARAVLEKRRAGYAAVKATFTRSDEQTPPFGNSYYEKATRALQKRLSEQQKLNREQEQKIEELIARNRWLATEIKSVERRGARPIDGEDIPKKVLNFSVLLKLVSARSSFSPSVLLAQRRHRTVTYWRHILMYLAHQLTGYSYPQIGRLTGGRDHTTVLNGVRKITAMRLIDTELDTVITELEREVGALFP